MDLLPPADPSVRAALEALPAFGALGDDDRAAVRLACRFHEEEAHPAAAARHARRALWESGVPFALREQVCGLVRFAALPTSLFARDDALRRVCAASLACRPSLLAVMGDAISRGCGRPASDDIALFRLFCEEQGCLDGPWPFPSDHTRVSFFRSSSRPPDQLVHDDCRAELVMLSGLPGAGKDTWVRDNLPSLPTVSLDDLRIELDVAPDDDQGTVRQVGQQRIRAHLRRGEPFVILATNLDRQRRSPLLALAADYRFRVRIVYVEVPYRRLFAQNRGREAAVPERVIVRMTDRWEVPSLSEAHARVLHVDG